jgi:hypothetical protein
MLLLYLKHTLVVFVFDFPVRHYYAFKCLSIFCYWWDPNIPLLNWCSLWSSRRSPVDLIFRDLELKGDVRLWVNMLNNLLKQRGWVSFDLFRVIVVVKINRTVYMDFVLQRSLRHGEKIVLHYKTTCVCSTGSVF